MKTVLQENSLHGPVLASTLNGTRHKLYNVYSEIALCVYSDQIPVRMQLYAMDKLVTNRQNGSF